MSPDHNKALVSLRLIYWVYRMGAALGGLMADNIGWRWAFGVRISIFTKESF